MDATVTLYCVCQQEYDLSRFMIECEACKDWFHGSCVGVEEHQASEIEVYHCPDCAKIHGPIVVKKRNWLERLPPLKEKKGIQTGTGQFVKELKGRTFPSADQFVKHMSGYQITRKYLEESGFDYPIIVEKKEGLELRIPPSTISMEEIEQLVGPLREIDVIDVERQEDFKLLIHEWVEYFKSPNRQRILNVISLEFSTTRLSELVEPPSIVRELSWVDTVWGHEPLPEDCPYARPAVQKYCLMGVKDSFTDFHVDFGGTSVWYHVLRGEKIFYLIKPTQTNLHLYENWVSSANQSSLFFGDQVDSCYKCVLKHGQTLLIPTGWIHAVLTPIDSLVFGGNFLHSLNIPLQLQIYEMEKRVNTPEQFLFPVFETSCWYAARHTLELLKGKPVHRQYRAQMKTYAAVAMHKQNCAQHQKRGQQLSVPHGAVPEI
ncbi:PREDICTED: lysine-specific demethylase 7B-like [Priapulus caudatus]|uniref:Lysine-specific demethylase 7B-like n=1 Tax=Priapulus caudatus TaxID=37621 RepID=A0ABM1EM79_PRICU|nr:PREDICTED: lysine-specific demethylase 7B-like [Priapulus caudatus]